MVGQAVVRIGDADFAISAVALLDRHQEGDHARGIGLERGSHQVEHEVRMLGVVLRNACRGRLDGRLHARRVGLLGFLDAAFDLADGVEIFVDLAPVGGAERALQAARVLHHRIEHAPVVALHAGAAHGVEIEFGVAEQALEDGARPDLRRIRRRGRAPGDAVASRRSYSRCRNCRPECRLRRPSSARGIASRIRSNCATI